MEELSVFQQQQQPLDFRTTNFAAAAYEMSARLNNPLLGAVKSSNSISQSHLFLQALQTNPALLNEYIRVSGINSAASSVVGSTSTTIPNGNKQNDEPKYIKNIYIRYFSYFIYLLVNEA